jgi:hypothetical protein
VKRVKYAGAPVRPDNHKKPIIANYSNPQPPDRSAAHPLDPLLPVKDMEGCFPVNMVKDWFDRALRKDAGKPSDAACKRLARDMQIAINQVDNLEKRKIGRDDLKDADHNEVFQAKIAPLLDAAGKFITNAPAFEKEFGNYVFWEDTERSITLLDVVSIMHRVAALQRPPVSQMPTMGRRTEAWHVAARAISPLIETVMREAGHSRNLSAAKNSPVAVFGAEAINRAYEIKIKPEGFATALRGRSRRKAGKADNEVDLTWNYDEIFPAARRRGP